MTKPSLRTVLTGGAVGAILVAGAFTLPATASTGADSGDDTTAFPFRHRIMNELTDEQRACLDDLDLDLTRPESRPSAAERDARRQAVRDALESCGIELPAPGDRLREHLGLTDEQQACLDDLDLHLTRPESRPSAAERDARRQAMRDALESCGIELPARGDCARDHGGEMRSRHGMRGR